MCEFRSKMHVLDLPKSRARVGYKVVNGHGDGLFFSGFGSVKAEWVRSGHRPLVGNTHGWYTFCSRKGAEEYREGHATAGRQVVRVLVCGHVVKGRAPDSGREGYRAEWIKRAPRPQTSKRKGRQK